MKDIPAEKAQCFPPCIRALFDKAAAEQPLPARQFSILTAFLVGIGERAEASNPARPLDCGGMKALFLCTGQEGLCQMDWVSHPFVYYRARRRRMELSKPSHDRCPAGVPSAGGSGAGDTEKSGDVGGAQHSPGNEKRSKGAP